MPSNFNRGIRLIQPRVDARGNVRLRRILDLDVLASIQPRTDARGNPVTHRFQKLRFVLLFSRELTLAVTEDRACGDIEEEMLLFSRELTLAVTPSSQVIAP